MIDATEFAARLARLRELSEANRSAAEDRLRDAARSGMTGLERKTCQGAAKACERAADAYEHAARIMETGI